MTKMWVAVMCTAIALEKKKDAILTDKIALSGSSGLREAASVKTAKAQGRCGTDTLACSNGEVAQRDPANTCRFAHCETSLVEESDTQPTYQWTGVSIADDQNFCSRMTRILGNYENLAVADCNSQPSNCEEHYVHLADGKVGDIAHCENTTGSCAQGAIHNCTWSFYMEDLMTKHNQSTDNCASKLLETKRSLDGLLHSVQDVYNQLMEWNAIVQAENQTIRERLEDQQGDWNEYVSEQEQCDSTYSSDNSTLQEIDDEMQELRAIANPDVRSAVNFTRATGYQSEADANYAAGTPTSGTSFVEVGMDESACQTFTSLVERVQKKHGVKLVQTPLDCHAARENLTQTFAEAFRELGDSYNSATLTMAKNRTVCLSLATYKYKAGVEGIDGIDDSIQDAAGKIHEAQGEIARLEPMLHDVERAVERMREYVQTINRECALDRNEMLLYAQIRDKIIALAECPGRNDFTINVPHWTKATSATPVPTPWYEDGKAAANRPLL